MLSPNHMRGAAASAGLNQTQKVLPGRQQGNNPIVINPQNIEFARGLTNSQKDKRLTMFPEDIKKFVVDSNQEKAILKEFDNSLKDQDIRTKVGGNPNQSQNSANYGIASRDPKNRSLIGKNLSSIATLQS